MKHDFEVVHLATYKWLDNLDKVDPLNFHECKCFGGYCQSRQKQGIFVRACENKASVGDYKMNKNK